MSSLCVVFFCFPHVTAEFRKSSLTPFDVPPNVNAANLKRFLNVSWHKIRQYAGIMLHVGSPGHSLGGVRVDHIVVC